MARGRSHRREGCSHPFISITQQDRCLLSNRRAVIPPARQTKQGRRASSKPAVSSWVVVSPVGVCVESLVPMVPLPPMLKHKSATSHSRNKVFKAGHCAPDEVCIFFTVTRFPSRCVSVVFLAGWEAACCQRYCCVNSFFRHLFVLPVSLMCPCYGCSIVPTKTSRNFSKGICSYLGLQEQRVFFNWYLNLKPNCNLQPHRPPLLALYLSSFLWRTWALSWEW